MALTPNLALPLLAAAQAQKHVTHNEALSTLDALVQLAVVERRAAPPGSPAEGERHLVAAGATGAFAGHERKIALFDLGAWRFLAPRAGWIAYVAAEDTLLVYDGAAWQGMTAYGQDLDNLPRLGIGTAADAVNRLAAKLNAALFTALTAAEGGSGDLRFVLNKEGAAGVLAQLYQSGYSGRAETGLVGDEDYRIRVSGDGSVWRDALRVDRATGVVSFPSGATGLAGARNLLVNADGAVNQRVFAGGSLAQGAYGYDRWKAGTGGCTVARAADDTFTLTGPLVQVIERPGLAGQVVTVSVEDPTGPLTVSVEGVSDTIAAGSGRRGVTLAVPAAATGNVTLTLTGSGVSFARPVLNRGPTLEPFERLPPGLALRQCQRYYAKTFAPGTAPTWNTGSSGALFSYAIVANAIPMVRWQFPVQMRAVPTLTFYNPTNTNNQWSVGGANAIAGMGATTPDCVRIGTATVPTISVGTFTTIHAVADAEL
ncbi:MAG TPA: DUF2793 domain-containing protein [Microvirga sp.]|nr:DUF2793 domain-containing protein [Microvirga sp.]